MEMSWRGFLVHVARKKAEVRLPTPALYFPWRVRSPPRVVIDLKRYVELENGRLEHVTEISQLRACEYVSDSPSWGIDRRSMRCHRDLFVVDCTNFEPNVPRRALKDSTSVHPARPTN